MSHNIAEVKITLTPLSPDEEQNHRTIIIGSKVPSVTVGRASKSPQKDLIAAPNNAWFDYPILSRNHAKFTHAPHQQRIYIQDCGSTHGTYIGKRMLDAHVAVAVTDGEVITFGQSVRSGAITYPAKHFRVHSKWELASEVKDSCPTTNIKIQRPVSTSFTNRPAFTNEFYDSSEPSRESSVQIVVEPHRHTFSVPSSDDEAATEDEEDEVQIASSVRDEETEVISAATTPDQQAVGGAYNNTKCLSEGFKAGAAPRETRGLNLKGPSLQDLLTRTAKDGTSQDNPINLEGVCTNIIDVDTESEDEGPEVVPFHKLFKCSEPTRSKEWDKPQAVCQMSAVRIPISMSTNEAEKENNQDSEIQRYSIVPETQAKESEKGESRDCSPTSDLAESTTGASDDFDSEDDDGFDYDHESFADDLEQLNEHPALNVENPANTKPSNTFQVGNGKQHHTVLTPPSDDYYPTGLDLSVSDAIDVSKPAEPLSIWTRRAPSPSDAALARKASDPKKILSRDIFDSCPVPKWPPLHNYFHEHEASRETGFISWPELQNPKPRFYDQGPFSTQEKAPTLENSKNQVRQATVTWEDPYEDDDMIMKDRFSRTGRQASKITIPSLVENHPSENHGSLKRKYEGITGVMDIGAASKASSPATRASGSKRTFAEFSPAHSLEEDPSVARLQSHAEHADLMLMANGDNATQYQDGHANHSIPLPDAQPREDLFHLSTASTSQGSSAEAALDSVAPTTPSQGQCEEGPTPKKAKTSSSSSGGIGKFVMGMGFGLLGAAAAFVATIPASVYEEALREFSNAA